MGPDRLVLGAVVHEHAPHVLHQADGADVADQEQHLERAVDEVEGDRAGPQARAARSAGAAAHEDEQTRRAARRSCTPVKPGRARRPCPACGSAGWSRPAGAPPRPRRRPRPPARWAEKDSAEKPFIIDSSSTTPPRRNGQRRKRCRSESERQRSSRTTSSPPGRRQATANERGERIITPSMTAWPPTLQGFGSGLIRSAGARRRRRFAPSGANAHFAVSSAPVPRAASRPYLRLKRSMRPAESTSFCLPV